MHAVQNNSNFWQGGWHEWHWASKSEENFAQEINVSLMYRAVFRLNFKFLDLESRCLFKVELIKFSPFSESEVCLFCNKTINANNKT